VVVFAAAIALHELGHVAAGFLGGGAPSFVSSTDTRGEWGAMGRGGFVALGASGSLVNVVLAAFGLALLARFQHRGNHSAAKTYTGARHFSGRAAETGARHFSAGLGTGASHLFAWLLFAVNASLVGVYLTVSPLADFGDWNTVIHRFEPQLPLRLLLAAVGAGLTVWATRTAARTLAPLVAPLPAESRNTRTQTLVRACWLSGGTLAVAAALFSPLGLGWALFIAVGSTLGCTWPITVAARMTTEGKAGAAGKVGARRPQADAPREAGAPSPLIPAHRGWIAAGVVAGAVLVFVFGPGIVL